jgi:hypothetical protein
MNERLVASRPPFDLVAIAFLGVLGHVLLARGSALPPWLLPCALAVALVARPHGRPAFDGLPTKVLVVAGFVAIAYGSLATQDRSWDGFATWSLTARHLAAGETLAAPYFANPSVYHATPGYPLLQPILLQQSSLWLGEAGGRILFPLLWLALLFAVRGPLLAMGVHRHVRALTVAGLALVPLFTEPGHGSAESGFADLLLALLVTHGAAAILLGRWPAAALVGLCLPLCKIEGTVHLFSLCLVAPLFASWRAGLAVAAGGAIALAGWLPVQAQLTHRAADLGGGVVALVALLPLLLVGFGAVMRMRRVRIVVVGLGLVGGLWLPSLIGQLPAGLGQAALALGTQARWSAVGEVLATIGGILCWFRKLGGSFVVLAAALVAVRLERVRAARTAASVPSVTPLLALLGCGLLAVVLFLLTRPAEDLGLFLREGTVRYLSQLLGVVWLAIGMLLHRQFVELDEPGDAGVAASGRAARIEQTGRSLP